MPREGGKLQTYMFVTFLFHFQQTMETDNGLPISAHFGTTNAGRDFKDFLGDDEYENNFMARFDDFLHESFSMCRNPIVYHDYAKMTNLLTGPEVRKSRACGHKEEGDDDEKDPSDFEDASHSGSLSEPSTSHVPSSGQEVKRKNIVSAILSQFHRSR